MNALRVVQKLDDYADASYVEGVASLNGGPLIEHGWVCLSDGTVIDPTTPRRSGAYFPGLEFRGRAGIEEFLATPQGSTCKVPPSSTPSAGVVSTPQASSEPGNRVGRTFGSTIQRRSRTGRQVRQYRFDRGSDKIRCEAGIPDG